MILFNKPPKILLKIIKTPEQTGETMRFKISKTIDFTNLIIFDSGADIILLEISRHKRNAAAAEISTNHRTLPLHRTKRKQNVATPVMAQKPMSSANITGEGKSNDKRNALIIS